MAPDAPGSPQVKHIVTCFLQQNFRILLLKRSQHVSTFKGKWAAVSGYIEAGSDRQSLVEIEEETGLLPTDVMLIKKGDTVEVEDIQSRVRWVVHPYLYKVIGDKPVRIDWEHDEFQWIEPNKLGSFETVLGLAEALSRVYPV
ncbi:MAG: NUDIX domain-containing protein [Dehalococcoidia bacterium]|nr:MAG: NUDIX domain-containing protein [Dehalococcoidia bacterium]